ncbi:MAG: biotin--[acetyl-CoA-carboxylase] ligase [Rickettsiales bacterium]
MISIRKKKIISNLLDDYHLLSFDSLDSTNEEAKRMARSGGSHGAVIWAKSQDGGKGRMGRSWVSDDGNLFVSILLRPQKDIKELSQLSFVASVAICDAISPMLAGDNILQTKWPNDILLNGKKLGGILLESFMTEGNSKNWVVVGLGVNIDSYPSKTDFPATCLKDAGVELVSAKIILSRFIHHFIERYDEWESKGFTSIRASWLKNVWNLKKNMVACLPNEQLEGVFDGVDKDGSLIMVLGGGKKRSILAADIYASCN